MKRHITEYEQKLINNGWKLIQKTYKGKYSQFVWTYVYLKSCDKFLCEVVLDKKREKTIGIYIENYKNAFIGLEQLQELNKEYLEISNEIHLLEFGKPLDEDDEIVEIVESVENE